VNLLSSVCDICIQTMLIGGAPCNVTEEDLDEYFDKVRRIRPKEVHIYSIDRPIPSTSIVQVLPKKLEEIAVCGQEMTGVTFAAFNLGQERYQRA